MPKAIRRSLNLTPLLDSINRQNIQYNLGSVVEQAFSMETESTLVENKIRLLQLNQTDREAEKLAKEDDQARSNRINELSALWFQYEHDAQKRLEITEEIDELKAIDKNASYDAYIDLQVANGRMKSPEALNEQYGYLGLDFKNPMTERAAELQADIKRREIIQQTIISRGPQGSLPAVSMLGAGLLKAAIDPLGLAVGFIPFYGQARTLALSAKIGKIRGRMVEGAIEGTAGATLLEPAMYFLSKDQQLDYTLADSMLNVGAGVLLGAGVGTIAGAFAKANKDMSVPSDRSIVDEILAAEIEIDPNVKVDVEPEERLEQIKVRIADDVSENNYQKRTPRLRKYLKEAMEISMALIANGKRIDLSFFAPYLPETPETLTQWVKSVGGVSDARVNVPEATSTKGQTKTKESAIEDETSVLTLEQLAKMAKEEGFIESDDVNLLISKLQGEIEGVRTFRKKDLNNLKFFLEVYKAKTYDEAVQKQMLAVRENLDSIGVKASDEQIISALDLVAKGQELDLAFKTVGLDVAEARAKAAAENGLDKKKDMDYREDADDPSDGVPDDETQAHEQSLKNDKETVENLREQGKLDEDDEQFLADGEKEAEQADNLRKLNDVAYACHSRS